jgi:2'-5' RNA ligase
MDTLRTFVAAETAPAVVERAQALIERLRVSQADVKWVGPQNLHLTLKFLGEVPAADTAEICTAVAEVAATFQPLSVGFRGAGAFPDTRRPRTIWLGVQSGLEQISALQKAVDRALRALGYPKEDRQFHPHLTLGRVRNAGPRQRELTQLLREHGDFEAGVSEIHEVVVFASHLDRTGPTYEPLGRARLGT